MHRALSVTHWSNSPTSARKDGKYRSYSRPRLASAYIVREPKGRNIVPCRWVFAMKSNLKGEVIRHKARFEVKGFSEVKGVDYDEEFSTSCDSTR